MGLSQLIANDDQVLPTPSNELLPSPSKERKDYLVNNYPTAVDPTGSLRELCTGLITQTKWSLFTPMFKYIQRSAAEVAESSAKAIRMDGLQGWKKELPLMSLNSKKDLKQWAIGCDKDIGGFSKASLELTPKGTGLFHGTISLELPVNREIEQSGYAAIRSKERDATMWGTPCWDTSLFRYLALRVKGDNRKYFVNIQTDTYFQTDLFQHRLFLRTPGQWETVMIPFRDFVFTSNGMIMPDQVEMFREKIKTVGVSIMDRQEGPFSLEIDWIKAMNSENTEGDEDRASEVD